MMGDYLEAGFGDVDVDQLRSGLAAIEATPGGGRPSDVTTVLTRVFSELQKMAANAQLLSQKQNFISAAFDNWANIIQGLLDRAKAIQTAVGSETWPISPALWPAGIIPPSQHWDETKVLAVEVANASNQLESELNAPPWLLIAGIGVVGLLGYSLIVAPMLGRKGIL